MVKVIYCDRCGKELKIIDKEKAEANSLFEDHLDWGIPFPEIAQLDKVRRPQLCSLCGKAYNNIISKTNEAINIWIKEKDKEKVANIKNKSWWSN